MYFVALSIFLISTNKTTTTTVSTITTTNTTFNFSLTNFNFSLTDFQLEQASPWVPIKNLPN